MLTLRRLVIALLLGAFVTDLVLALLFGTVSYFMGVVLPKLSLGTWTYTVAFMYAFLVAGTSTWQLISHVSLMLRCLSMAHRIGKTFGEIEASYWDWGKNDPRVFFALSKDQFDRQERLVALAKIVRDALR